MTQNCREQILDDIVRVELIRASDCSIPWPYRLEYTELDSHVNVDGESVAVLGAATLSVALKPQSSDNGLIKGSLSLKQNEKLQMSGTVVSHELTVPVDGGVTDTREALKSLRYTDFHAVLTSREGVRWLIYACPSGSYVQMDEQNLGDVSLKISLISYSHVIRLRS